MKMIIHLGLTVMFLWVLSILFSGIEIYSIGIAVVAGVVLCLINATIKPIILIIALPFNVLSLGFLTLVINGAMLMLAARWAPGFYIDGFWTAFWGAIVYTMLNSAISVGDSNNSTQES